MTARLRQGPAEGIPDPRIDLRTGDALEVLAELPDGCVDCVVTSPPYWGTRDYRVAGQYGHEPTVHAYVRHLAVVFAELHRVVTDEATCWLVLGDTYAGSWGNYAAPRPRQAAQPGTTRAGRSRRRVAENGRRSARYGTFRPPQAALPAKNLLGVPWRVAFALQADGWLLENAIVWHKPHPMPESVRDRLSQTHEYVFLLRKRPGHHFPGDMWSIDPDRRRGAPRISAAFPIELPRRCVAMGCRHGGTVLDPFCGSGTTGLAALETGRPYIGIDLNPACILHARQRLNAIFDRPVDPPEHPEAPPVVTPTTQKACSTRDMPPERASAAYAPEPEQAPEGPR